MVQRALYDMAMKRLILVLVIASLYFPSVSLLALPPVTGGWQGTILLELQPAHDPVLEVLISEAELVFEGLAPSANKTQPYMLLHSRVNLGRTAVLIEARWLAKLSTQIVLDHLVDVLELPAELLQAGISVTIFPDKTAVAAYFSLHQNEWIARPQ